MAKQFLDRCNVNAGHDEVTGKGVPEIVEPEILDAGSSASGIERLLEILVGGSPSLDRGRHRESRFCVAAPSFPETRQPRSLAMCR